jgi:hypothetical protein
VTDRDLSKLSIEINIKTLDDGEKALRVSLWEENELLSDDWLLLLDLKEALND